jgi:hypothetical protein
MKAKGILKIVFLSLLIISFEVALSQPLQFSEETIEIKIFEGFAIVSGDYTFVNKSSNKIVRSLYYPFPVSQSFPYPDSIFVNDLNNKPLSFSKSSSGVYFSIKVLPDSETTIKVTYKQKLTSREMKYILTSTKNWAHPLQKADYIVFLPKQFNLTSLSPEPFKKDSDSANNIYRITKKNFMPDTDLIIKWARRKK